MVKLVLRRDFTASVELVVFTLGGKELLVGAALDDVQIRGRVMNVVGDTIDGLDALSREEALPIHREPPKFEDLTTSQEVLTRLYS